MFCPKKPALAQSGFHVPKWRRYCHRRSYENKCLACGDHIGSQRHPLNDGVRVRVDEHAVLERNPVPSRRRSPQCTWETKHPAARTAISLRSGIPLLLSLEGRILHDFACFNRGRRSQGVPQCFVSPTSAILVRSWRCGRVFCSGKAPGPSWLGSPHSVSDSECSDSSFSLRSIDLSFPRAAGRILPIDRHCGCPVAVADAAHWKQREGPVFAGPPHGHIQL